MLKFETNGKKVSLMTKNPLLDGDCASFEISDGKIKVFWDGKLIKELPQKRGYIFINDARYNPFAFFRGKAYQDFLDEFGFKKIIYKDPNGMVFNPSTVLTDGEFDQSGCVDEVRNAVYRMEGRSGELITLEKDFRVLRKKLMENEFIREHAFFQRLDREFLTMYEEFTSVEEAWTFIRKLEKDHASWHKGHYEEELKRELLKLSLPISIRGWASPSYNFPRQRYLSIDGSGKMEYLSWAFGEIPMSAYW